MLNTMALHLSVVDLGNLSMTCAHMRNVFEPILASQPKRLMFANPNLVRLVEPEHPEAYGINQEDLIDLSNDETDVAELWDNLSLLLKDLYACPMLAKYVKHVFIDYQKLSPINHHYEQPEGFEQVEHIIRAMNHLRPDEYLDHECGPEFWGSACGLAALILLILPNVESLVLVGCNCRYYSDRDPIMTAAGASLTPGSQQVRLRSLKHVYATGCVGSYNPAYSPWGLLVLPSIETVEFNHVSNAVLLTPAPEWPDVNALWQCARNWNGTCHLTSLHVRHLGLDSDSFYEMFEYMPFLKRLIYRCVYLIGRGDVDSPNSSYRGVHVERLGQAIQFLCESLEELVIEVSDIRDIWGHNRWRAWDREEDSDFVVSEASSSDESVIEEHNSEGCSGDDSVLIEGGCEPPAFPNSVDEFEEIPPSQLGVPTQEDLADTVIHHNPELILSKDREPSWDDRCPTFLGSLAAFRKLKTIKVPAITLQGPSVFQWSGRGVSKVLSDWNYRPSMRPKMKDLLPRSLERLTLFRLERDHACLDQDIEDILTEKASRLTNLMSVDEQQQPPWCQASQAEQQLWQFDRFRSYIEYTEEDMERWGSRMIPANWTTPDNESSPHGGAQD
ncbi:hypothetical protein G7Y79_00010g028920 [Physcia stellaris]|nr:hypothetical protein G7Y79_00010g028920 [Physcia stellaris]